MPVFQLVGHGAVFHERWTKHGNIKDWIFYEHLRCFYLKELISNPTRKLENVIQRGLLHTH
jgi:hypothetical protein